MEKRTESTLRTLAPGLQWSPAMDRPIDISVQRRRNLRRASIAMAVLVGAVVVVMGASRIIAPSIRRGEFRTARVEAGPIEATVTASGTVVPELEQVLSSPVDARVVRVLKRPGASLRKGEPILDLDLSASELAVDRIEQSFAIKKNEQARTRLDLESTLSSLSGQIEIKRLELQNLQGTLDRYTKLFADGLVSSEMLHQAELNAARAAVELRQLEDSEKIAQRATAVRIEGLGLEMQTLRSEKREAVHQLDLATTRSDRDGVLTYVVSEEGASVRKGDVLARIADLTAFRVDATVSDIHAGRLAVGMPAQVEVNGALLPGTVSRIAPSVQNGAMTLEITLDDKSDRRLRSNLRVDVRLVTDRKEHALKVARGPFAEGEGATEAFVVHGNTAVKTPIRLGVSGFESFEVTAGLAEGDEIIVSDTASFRHLKQVRIR